MQIVKKRKKREFNMNDHNLEPIKKGEVRNPNGRPKGAKSKKTLLKDIANITAPEEVREKLKELYPDINENTLNNFEALVYILYKKALKEENLNAIKEIMDREFGQSEQTVNQDIRFNKDQAKEDLKELLT